MLARPAPPRVRVDLRRLPRWTQYAISVAVVAVVVALAARFPSDRRVEDPMGLAQVLGAVFLVLLAVGLASRTGRRPSP
ncbi:hypothetical protein [Sorangium sp. So ce388]|uniref:hypothetical protein n=1 Tax=Sorangium sp. So ce388 TaxID=3133309 RepID=UPI003F5B21A1